jgi:hypothetical protein
MEFLGRRGGPRAVGDVFPAPATIRAMAFSPDGKRLLTGDHEGRVIVWDIGVESWLKRAFRIAGRELSPDERKRHMSRSAPQGFQNLYVSIKDT